MIELTEQQVLALNSAEDAPALVVNPQTAETFVLLRIDEYERLAGLEYDDSPLTREELEAITWETLDRREREDNEEPYDDSELPQ
jgi:hypothetical protein